MVFQTGSTRQIQAGDTPGFNDGVTNQKMSALNILKGQPSFLLDGVVTIANGSNYKKFTPFVPTETKDNTGPPTPAVTINGVGPGQQVALKNTHTDVLDPGEIIKIAVVSTVNVVRKWVFATDSTTLRYARYIGKEAGIFARAPSTPFAETLSTGVIPDESLLAGETGWFQLLEQSSGVV